MSLLKKKIIKEEVKIEPEKITELKTLLIWEAAVRPFKKRDREYYSTIAAIVFLLAGDFAVFERMVIDRSDGGVNVCGVCIGHSGAGKTTMKLIPGEW